MGSRKARGISAALCAIVVAVDAEDPKVLVLSDGARPWMPFGSLQPEHRTLQGGLRSWVERQTGLALGHVEQLYTFGDYRNIEDGGDAQDLLVAYLALTHPSPLNIAPSAAFCSWYACFPWEDWRNGRPPELDQIMARLFAWRDQAVEQSDREQRDARIHLSFGGVAGTWDDERVLDRYELLYQADLVPEAWFDRGDDRPDHLPQGVGAPMAGHHRRILATAIGRLRGKIKYRPLLFELMPSEFTLLRLQHTVEAILGAVVHKQNFRRLVARQGLVEETGAVSTDTGGRPAKLVRFRPEVTLERPSPGLPIRAFRSTGK